MTTVKRGAAKTPRIEYVTLIASRETHTVLKELAAAEERTIKAVLERAVALYAQAHPVTTKRTKKRPNP
jgi:hypothetical protein